MGEKGVLWDGITCRGSGSALDRKHTLRTSTVGCFHLPTQVTNRYARARDNRVISRLRRAMGFAKAALHLIFSLLVIEIIIWSPLAGR